ncbi:MAG: baseplate J/gp47 family protein [Rickettsiales bacterium]|jgi:hypothetical protein|nr:baseplate J/gp47 family protein [Rickettsiales bacterium]
MKKANLYKKGVKNKHSPARAKKLGSIGGKARQEQKPGAEVEIEYWTPFAVAIVDQNQVPLSYLANGDVFTANTEYAIPDSGNINVVYSAETFGSIPADPNSINIILDQINGLESVNNPSGGNIGRDVESDAEFRARIKISQNLNANTIIKSMKSSLENLTGVKSCYLYDNYENEAVLVDSLNVPPHSILAVVDGGDDNQVAQVIFDKKTIGTGYCDDDTVVQPTIVEVIEPEFGNSYNVSFYRPISQDIDISITVYKNDYPGDNLSADITDAIMNWYNGANPQVSGVRIGTDISPFEISAAVSSELPEIFISSVKIALHDGTLSSDTISFGAVHKAAVKTENIAIEIL